MTKRLQQNQNVVELMLPCCGMPCLFFPVCQILLQPTSAGVPLAPPASPLVSRLFHPGLDHKQHECLTTYAFNDLVIILPQSDINKHN